MTDHETASQSSPTPGPGRTTGTARVKRGLAEMLRGGVIMDVVTPEQARVAEDAGAVAVMALERVPADIRRDGGVARMSDPAMIEGIQHAVTIPVMAKCRIGHFAEAQVLEALGVDYVDESEVLTPADERVPRRQVGASRFRSCAARRTSARRCAASPRARALIRSKGEAGTGNIVEAVRHLRSILGDIRKLGVAEAEELYGWAKELRAPVELVAGGRRTRRAAGPAVLRGRHRDARPTPRSSCSSARRRCSSAAASSRSSDPAGSAQGRSSRRPRTTPTPTIVAKVSRGLGDGDARRGDRRPSTSSSPTAVGDAPHEFGHEKSAMRILVERGR